MPTVFVLADFLIFLNSRVIELRNDLRGLSDKIKELLDVVFARPEPSEVDEKVIPIEEILAKPFASCNGVAPGSPAATAVSAALS